MRLPSLIIVAFVSMFPAIATGQNQSPPNSISIKKLAFESGGYLSGNGQHSDVETLSESNVQPILRDIYVRDPFESRPRWIAEGQFPAWSPDGARLVYCVVGDATAFGQIRIVNADGKGDRQLTHLKTGACWPEWSPDGKRIAVSLTNGATSQIAIIDENGTLLQELGDGRAPHWSPDGRQLVFVRPLRHLARGSSIWTIGADGSHEKQLLEDGSQIVETGWLPNGSGIMFTSTRSGLSSVFTVDLDGKNVRQLGSDPTLQWFQPVLAPDGTSLIVEAATQPDAGFRRVSITQIDGKTHRATMLAIGMHFSILWMRPAQPNDGKGASESH